MRISDWSSDVCSSDLVDARAVADAAADLHLTREGGDDAFHRRAVDAGAREGAVEVDDVEVRGARIGEKARLRRRIVAIDGGARHIRSEEHTSELQSLMRLWYDDFCFNKQTHKHINH